MSDDVERIEFTEEIDLHHFHPRDSRGILSDFLDHAEEKGYAMVRIIHGKGRSTLKEMVLRELSRRESVQRYADDFSNWGATLAWLVRPEGPRGRAPGP